MRLLSAFSSSALLLPALVSAAGVCTSSRALSWPPVGDCATPGKFDTLVKNCRACCLNDAPCFQTCLKAGGIDVTDRRSVSGKTFIDAVPEVRGFGARAVELTCAVNEGCYKYTDGSLLCLSLGTGLYHDDVGGNGDYFSGEYTGPDGKVQTGTSTATATESIRSSSSTAQGTRSTTLVQTTSAAVASASASSDAGLKMAQWGSHGFAEAGFLGLVVGLAL